MGFDRWHRALAYALLGEDRPELGRQTEPRPDDLLAELDRAEVIAARDRASTAEQPWPYRLPDHLTVGLPWARHHALVTRLRSRLGVDGTEPSTPVRDPDAGGGRPDAEHRRLLEDRPPHWG